MKRSMFAIAFTECAFLLLALALSKSDADESIEEIAIGTIFASANPVEYFNPVYSDEFIRRKLSIPDDDYAGLYIDQDCMIVSLVHGSDSFERLAAANPYFNLKYKNVLFSYSELSDVKSCLVRNSDKFNIGTLSLRVADNMIYATLRTGAPSIDEILSFLRQDIVLRNMDNFASIVHFEHSDEIPSLVGLKFN